MKTKITYLKKLHNNPFTNVIKTQATVKIVDGKALHCYDNSIEVDGLSDDDTDAYFINFYENLGYTPATKEEFDNMYDSAYNEVNELRKL